eukprot:gene3599-biopygen2955
MPSPRTFWPMPRALLAAAALAWWAATTLAQSPPPPPSPAAATAGFPDDPQRFAAPDDEIDAVDRPHLLRRSPPDDVEGGPAHFEMLGEARDFQQRRLLGDMGRDVSRHD